MTSPAGGEAVESPAAPIPEAAPKAVPIPRAVVEKPKARKKPAKKKPVDLDPAVWSAQAIGTQIQGVHEIAAIFLGPAAKMPEASALAMGTAIHQIIELYGMDWLMRYLPWLGLILTTAACEAPIAMAVKADISRRQHGQKTGELPERPPSAVSLATLLPSTSTLEEEIHALESRPRNIIRAGAPRPRRAPKPPGRV